MIGDVAESMRVGFGEVVGGDQRFRMHFSEDIYILFISELLFTGELELVFLDTGAVEDAFVDAWELFEGLVLVGELGIVDKFGSVGTHGI
jgi:hypothetical protein